MTTRTGLKSLPFVGICGIAAALPVHAEQSVLQEYSFDLAEVTEVEFHASVGSMRIEPGTGNELKLVLEIEGKEGGWFRDDKNVADIELKSRVHGDRLILEQTEENTNTEWTIQLPAVARTTIEMGVGEIDAEFTATAVGIDLGVGDVNVTLPQASVGNIDLSVGVGEATLRGADATEADRMFISQDVKGHGDGTFDLEIDLGVGDIDVTTE